MDGCSLGNYLFLFVALVYGLISVQSFGVSSSKRAKNLNENDLHNFASEHVI